MNKSTSLSVALTRGAVRAALCKSIASALPFLIAAGAHAATWTSIGTDSAGTTSFDGGAGFWGASAPAPTDSVNALVGTVFQVAANSILRTTTSGASQTFGQGNAANVTLELLGDGTITAGANIGVLRLKNGNGATITVNNLVLSGGSVESGQPGSDLTLAGNITLTAGKTSTFNASTAADHRSLVVSSTISGSGNLQIVGTTGNNDYVKLTAANTYTGNTVLVSGPFVIGHQNALQASTLDTQTSGSSVGGITVDSTRTVSFDSAAGTSFTLGGLQGSLPVALQNTATNAITLTVGANSSTYSGGLTGAGSLYKSGTGILCLSGTTGSFSGNITVDGGTLEYTSIGNYGSNSALGTGGSTSIITVNSANLTFVGGAGAQSSNRNFVVVNTASLYSNASVAGDTLTLSGTFAPDSGNRSLWLRGSSGLGNIISGLVTNGTSGGSIGIYTRDSATWRLSNDSNSFTGSISGDGGALEFTSVANSGANSALGSGSTLQVNNSWLSFVGTSAQSTNRLLTQYNNGTLKANGATSAATLTLTGTVATNGGTLNLGGTNTGTNLISGLIQGTSTLYKGDSGTWRLSGTNNTFSGPISVGGGSLEFTSIGNYGQNSALGTGGSNATITINNASLTFVGGAGAQSSNRNFIVVNTASLISNASVAGDTLTLSGTFVPDGGNRTLWLRGSSGLGNIISGLVTNGTSGGSISIFTRDSATWRLSNDNNSFSGSVSGDGGALEFTSVANSGSNSALGSGSTLQVNNSWLSFVGTSAQSTNRLLTQYNNGTLKANGATSAATLTLTGTVTTNGGTLNLGGTNTGTNLISGLIQGPGNFYKGDSGTWRLSGTNSTFSGSISVGGGSLEFTSIGDYGQNSALGTGGSNATITINNASLTFVGGAGAQSSNRNINVVNTASLYSNSSVAGDTLTLSGTFAPDGGNRGLWLRGSSSIGNTISGLITNGTQGGSIGIYSRDSATWRLSNDNNSFTGSVGGDGGTLEFTSVGNIGVASALGSGSTLQVNNSTLSFVGTVAQNTNRPLTQYNWGHLAANGATSSATLTESGTITLNGGGGSPFFLGGTNTGANTMNGPLTGSGGNVRKEGAGTWFLAGANTYTGYTQIDSGTLAISGAGTLGATSASLAANGGVLDLGATTQTVGAVTLGGGSIQNGTLVGTSYLNTWNSTVWANLSGTGALTQSGGTLTLSGSNNFTAGVVIGAGVLQLGSAAALNSAVGSEMSVSFNANSNGTLSLNGNNVVVKSLNTNATVGNPYVQNASASPATLTVGNSANADSTYAGNIQDGSGGGSLSLIKAGTGTLTLTGYNTYTGPATVNGGTLKLQNSGFSATARPYSVSAGTTLGLDGNASFASGTTSIGGAGTLQVTGTVGAATPTSVLNMALGSGALIDVETGGWITNGGWSGIVWTNNLAGLQLNGGTLDLWNGSTVMVDALTGSGTVTHTNYGTSVTLQVGVNGGSGTFAGTITETSTHPTALVKSGAGTQTLSGSNSYSGGTAVNGGTLAISGAGTLGDPLASLAVNSAVLDLGATSQSAGAVTIAGGTIQNGTLSGTAFTSTGGTVSANLSGTGGLTHSTGLLTLTGSNSYSGGTIINSGIVAVNSDASFGAASGSVTLANGSSLKFANDITFNSSRNFTVSGGASFDPTLDTQGHTVTINGSITSAGNLVRNRPGTLILGGSNSYPQTILYSGTLGLTGAGTLGGNTASIWAQGGVLDLGATSQTVGPVTFYGGTVQNGTLQGSSFTGYTGTVGANLSGTGALTMTGSATLVLSGSNNYSGGTLVNSGTLQLSGASAPSTSGSISFRGGVLQYASGVTTDISNAIAGSTSAIKLDVGSNTVTFAGLIDPSNTGGLTKSGTGTLLLTGTYAGNGGLIAADTGVIVASGKITGSVGVSAAYSWQNGGTLTLANDANDFTGAVTNPGGGSIHFTSIADVGLPSALGSGTGAISVNNSNLTYIGTANQSSNRAFYVINAASIKNNGSGALTLAGEFTGPGNIQWGGTSMQVNTISGNIDTTGNVNVVDGAYLKLSGANTFTGSIAMANGTLEVESLNRVSGGTASSSAGAPSSVQNGTISLAGSGYGYLKYTGAGESTDRLLAMANAGSWNTATLDASGSGPVVFENGLTVANGFNLNRAIVLTGSNTGTNELLGPIVCDAHTDKVTLTKNGLGTWLLSGSSNYTGNTAINQGVLELNSADAITVASGRPYSIASGAALAIGGSVPDASIATVLGKVATNSAGAFALGADTSQNIDFTGFTALSFGAIGNVSYTGDLTPNANTYRLGGAGGTLTYNNAISNSSGVVDHVGAGTVILGGSLSIAGLNANGGSTQIQQSGSIGALNIASGATVSMAANSDGTRKVLDISSLTIAGFTSALASANGNSSASQAVEAFSPAAVPEPGTLGLLFTAATGLLGFRRRPCRGSKI